MTLPAPLVLLLTAAACWDAWRWYFARIAASPEEGLALLFTVLFLAALTFSRRAPANFERTVPLLPAAALLAGYAVSCAVAPPIVRAAIAIAAALFVLYRSTAASAPPPAFWALIALSLPVLPSLQFVLGYPMRVLSAALTVGLLSMHGLSVERQGTFLTFQGETLQFDAPCSGIAMLWAALMLTLMSAVLFRWGALRTVLAVLAACIFAIAANAFRAASLFYLETLFHITAADPMHEAAGLAAFLLAALLLLHTLKRIDRTELRIWTA